MPKFEQTCFSLDGRRFSVIWFSESIRNWRVIFLLYEAGGTDFCCEVLNKCREIRTYASRIRDGSVSDQISGFPYANAGTKVVARSKISPLSDQISDQIPVPPLSGFVIWFFFYTTLLTQRLSNPMWEIPRFLTKFSSVARDSTKLRCSSGNARNVPLKSGMCSLSCIHVIHV